ncbi:MAG: ATP-binding protein [Planctomycetota bacterium]
MDPLRNPYAPGAGTQPPELAGRDSLRESVRVAIGRIRAGRAAKSTVLTGLRGVGKTVLLDRLMLDAQAEGITTIRIEAPEGRSLPSILAPELRRTLLGLSRIEEAKDLAARAMRGLAGFLGTMRLVYHDVQLHFDAEPEPGLADNGDLEADLQALFEAVGEAARAARTAVVLFVDEMQYIETKQLGALITALHRIAQRGLPITLVGAGLPQLPARFGTAKSYAERLFDVATIGPLSQDDAVLAIREPAAEEGADIEPAALDRIYELTAGYPYFLQEWGKQSWDVARSSPIRLKDVEIASEVAVVTLDASFFHVRFDRLSPSEKLYLRAMADLGPGPHRSGDIAEGIGRDVRSVAPVRNNLISKGMVWSPSYGDTAFTVPLFDQFMRRIVPGDDWRP